MIISIYRTLNKIAIFLIIILLFGAMFIGMASGFDNNYDNNITKISSLPIPQNSLVSTEPTILNENELMSTDISGTNNEVFSFKAPNQQEPINLRLEFPNLNIQTGDTYSSIIMDDLSLVGAYGEPELPNNPVTFKFKPGTDIIKVDFIPGEIFSENLRLPLKPVQEPIPVSELYDVYSYGEPDPTPPNTKIYSSTNVFPKDWFTTDSGMGLDFNTGLTTLFFNVRIFPVRYIPGENELIYTTTGELTIEFQEPKTDTNTNDNANTNDRSAGPPTLSQQYRLLIIGPDIFRQNLTRLAEYKNNTGIPSKFVSLTEIYDGKYFSKQGSDQQENIKYFIYNARKSWNITYVILGGDTPLVPHRNAYIAGEEGNTPSDLYYADLLDSKNQFCDWNYDNDDKYGEWDSGNVDKADLYADVIVGRLPASSTTELKVLVDKIINYESFTYGQTWFDNVTMCGTDTFTAAETPEGEYACEYIDENYLDGFVTTKIYETTTYARDLPCTSTNIVNTLNKGAGFATFHDHGAPTSWAGKFSNSNALSLKNGEKLPFLNLDACSTGYFDLSSGDSLTEVVVLNPNGGAITSIGASRLGYGQYGKAHITRYSGYFNVHLYHNYYNGEGTAGRIFQSAKHDYLDNIPLNTMPDFKTIVEFILFGDPSLSIGGIPLQNINISCENNESYVEPSKSVEYNIKISNNGTYGRPIRLYVGGIPDTWSAYLNETLVFVPPDDFREVKLIVNASKIAKFNEVANIEVYAFYSKNMDRTISVVTKTITKRIYAVELNTTQLMDSVFPGETASFWFRVYNRGNDLNWIDVNATMDPPLPGWIFNFSQVKLNIEPFTSQLITLKINIPKMTYHGTYSVNVTSKISNYFGDKSTDSMIINVNVLRTYGLRFEPDKKTLQNLDPGTKFVYNLKLDNLGNYRDKFQLSLLMYPPSWNLSLSKKGQFEIEAFSNQTEQLTFEIPNQTLVGKYNIKARAQSIGNYSVLENLNFDIRINRTYGIEYYLDVYNVSCNPGELRFFNITIMHLGNDNDQVQLGFFNLPNKWYSKISSTIELEPFQVYTIPFELSPHKNAENGTYIFQLTLTLNGNLKTYMLGLNFTVNQINGFSFYCNNAENSVDSGGSQKFSFYLENLGNHYDEFEFNVSNIPDNWSVSWTPEGIPVSGLRLAPFTETNSISLKVNTYYRATAETYMIVVTAKIKSTGEEIVAYLFLTINAYYKISLELDRDDSNFQVFPGGEYKISLNLTNEGNSRDDITRTLLGIPEDWYVMSPKKYTFNLEPFQKRREVIRFEVPLDEYEHDINLTILASSDNDPELIEQERSVISVKFEPKPKDEDNSGDFIGSLFDPKNVQNTNFFNFICLPIIVLIVVVIIISILLIRQRKNYKREQAELEDELRDLEDADEYPIDDEYYNESIRLYGTAAAGRSRGARRMPPPPPPPPIPPTETTKKSMHTRILKSKRKTREFDEEPEDDITLDTGTEDKDDADLDVEDWDEETDDDENEEFNEWEDEDAEDDDEYEVDEEEDEEEEEEMEFEEDEEDEEEEDIEWE